MDSVLAVITQNRGLEKVMKRASNHFGSKLSLHESCDDFVKSHSGCKRGVVVIDATVCSHPRLMDLQMVLNEAPLCQVLYLPRTKRRQEIKEAMGLGAFGCLHKPLNEQEIRQMVESALGV